ncbi:MAG: rod-binding protein [Rhodobacteraceae bacterium]|nr:rod-binding protein [Paracoccaceae bacterium]
MIPGLPATPSPPPSSPAARQGQGDAALRAAAERLEATFLAEMLKAAGVGAPRQSFGGGPGEDQFASFLREEQARAMVGAGGIGLAESLFEALKERSVDRV